MDIYQLCKVNHKCCIKHIIISQKEIDLECTINLDVKMLKMLTLVFFNKL